VDVNVHADCGNAEGQAEHQVGGFSSDSWQFKKLFPLRRNTLVFQQFGYLPELTRFYTVETGRVDEVGDGLFSESGKRFHIRCGLEEAHRSVDGNRIFGPETDNGAYQDAVGQILIVCFGFCIRNGGYRRDRRSAHFLGNS
jgi:hypothetical protein